MLFRHNNWGKKTWCVADIEVRAEMESDKKLEKLETFLGRLNSKGKLIDARSAHFLVLFAGGCYKSIIEVRVEMIVESFGVFKKKKLHDIISIAVTVS